MRATGVRGSRGAFAARGFERRRAWRLSRGLPRFHLSVLKSIVEKVGVPEVLYVDQAGHFGKRFNRVIHLNWQEHLTQVERAMQELGCRVLFASSPQAKGRIERMWNTFQDRLIPELRVASINRIPAANEFLSKQFVPAFNQRFAVKPQ